MKGNIEKAGKRDLPLIGPHESNTWKFVIGLWNRTVVCGSVHCLELLSALSFLWTLQKLCHNSCLLCCSFTISSVTTVDNILKFVVNTWNICNLKLCRSLDVYNRCSTLSWQVNRQCFSVSWSPHRSRCMVHSKFASIHHITFWNKKKKFSDVRPIDKK